MRVGVPAHAPPFIISTITYRVAVNAPAERADIDPPISTLPLYVLCGVGDILLLAVPHFAMRSKKINVFALFLESAFLLAAAQLQITPSRS